MRIRLILGALLLVLAGTAHLPGSNAVPPVKIREPAVAGLFYPKDPRELASNIESCLAGAPAPVPAGRLVALICPHAGYAYSGPVAGSGYRLLRGAEYRTVILLAPSHYALLSKASVSDATVFRTPLGDVPITPLARQLAEKTPFALEPRCQVQRPEWATEASRPVPRAGTETADTWEHADEVEVPFLQKTLGRFDLLPVVFGEVDPAAAANALAPLVDAQTLIVASSDLSHYHAYGEAQRLDRQCVDAICALDVRAMVKQEACGRTPILTLMHLARQRGWRPQLLDYRNSGDTAGDKSRVVGYAAIAFFASDVLAVEPGDPTPATIAPVERRSLLRLARESLQAAAARQPAPEVQPSAVTKRLAEPAACFVTLTERGELRGCIGTLVAHLPLYQAVIDNTRSAALRDPRFRPITKREVDRLAIEISVLTAPRPLAFSSPDDLLRQLQPHRDGVVLQVGSASATYLPQVWEQLPDKIGFLDSLAEKAGLRPRDWQRRDATVSTYEVISFRENAP